MSGKGNQVVNCSISPTVSGKHHNSRPDPHWSPLQFEDYSKVVADMFDPAEKARSRAERFPEDCKKAFELGAELTVP